eukprot:Seg1000.11 transcript_id=Seg1000.11/GoldUCD/mRNA.D3Y31 product="hypothetical protein" protein_id=Seg1000.11/GoldUCD/D3Y31
MQNATGNNKNNSNGQNRSEQYQKQDFQRGKQIRNKTGNQGTNITVKYHHPSESNSNKKKFKVLIVGDSQLRRVDESKLSNSHRDVEKRFQPGMRIGQAVDKAGKSNSDVIIVHAATNNVASSTPEKLCEETVRTLKQIQANNPKAKVVFSSIFKRKDNMALNNKVKKVNELLENELALNGLDIIDNSNIMFSNLWDDGLHINDGDTAFDGGEPGDNLGESDLFLEEDVQVQDKNATTASEDVSCQENPSTSTPSRKRSNPIPKLIDNKRKNLERSLREIVCYLRKQKRMLYSGRKCAKQSKNPTMSLRVPYKP